MSRSSVLETGNEAKMSKQVGGSVGEAQALAQIVILGFWDQDPHLVFLPRPLPVFLLKSLPVSLSNK